MSRLNITFGENEYEPERKEPKQQLKLHLSKEPYVYSERKEDIISVMGHDGVFSQTIMVINLTKGTFYSPAFYLSGVNNLKHKED